MAPPPPPEPLLRFDQIRQIDTSGDNESEEAFARGRYWEADCIATDTAGDFVYVTGASVGGVRQVTRVDVFDPDTMPSVGVIILKRTTTRCVVQAFGEIAAVGLVPQGRYWIGTDSRLAANFPPRPVGGIVVAQVVGVALDTTALLLRPDLNPFKLRG